MSEEDIRAAAMPTQPPENAELAATQEDRDAAVMLAALWQTKSVAMHGHAIDTKDGRCDHTPIVQAFARHRLASLSSPVLPGVREAIARIIAPSAWATDDESRRDDRLTSLKRADMILALLPSESPNHG